MQFLIESASGRIIQRMCPPGQIECVALSADGRYALAGTGAEKPTLQEMDRDWDSLYKELLKRPRAHKLHVWDVNTGQELVRCVGHTGSVTAIAASSNGRVALSAGADRSVRLWSIG